MGLTKWSLLRHVAAPVAVLLACAPAISACEDADGGPVPCSSGDAGDPGQFFEDGSGRYCAYVVVKGGFRCPAELTHRIELDDAVVCSDRDVTPSTLPEEVCRAIGLSGCSDYGEDPPGWDPPEPVFCPPSEPLLPVRGFDFSAAGSEACSASSVLSSEDEVAGLDRHADRFHLIDQQPVSGCVAVDFGAPFLMEEVQVVAGRVPSACGTACEGEQCDTGAEFRVFAGTSLADLRQLADGLVAEPTLQTFLLPAGEVTQYVVACRGGWAASRDDVVIDAVSATCSPDGPPPDAGPSCVGVPFEPPQLDTQLSTADRSDKDPELSPDGNAIYFSRFGGGAGGWDVWSASRADRASAFGAPVNLAFNTIDYEFGPAVAPDGLTLYFSFEARDGNDELMQSARPDAGAPFGVPVALAGVNTPDMELDPTVTADGLELVFASNRPGGMGSHDLYIARRGDVSAPFGEVRPLEQLNSPALDASPFLTADGLVLYFSSNRSGGAGDSDIWVATRADRTAPFSEPMNVTSVNGPAAEQDPSLSADGELLYFMSTRPGGLGFYDIWFATRTCP